MAAEIVADVTVEAIEAATRQLDKLPRTVNNDLKVAVTGMPLVQDHLLVKIEIALKEALPAHVAKVDEF